MQAALLVSVQYSMVILAFCVQISYSRISTCKPAYKGKDMGLLGGLMGNASEVDGDKLQQELADVLVAGESVDSAYKVLRDTFVFTNKRLILIDRQGLTGKKVEYLSVPYKSMVSFAVETAGTFDMDSELKIWISGQGVLQKTFSKGSNIVKVQQSLAKYVLG